jgi:hypothetical protein
MRRLFGRPIGPAPRPEGLRTPPIVPMRDPNVLRELIRTDALQDWLRDLRGHELDEVALALAEEQLRRRPRRTSS